MLSSFDFDLVIHVTLFIISLFFHLFISVIYSLYYYLILLFLFLSLKKT